MWALDPQLSRFGEGPTYYPLRWEAPLPSVLTTGRQGCMQTPNSQSQMTMEAPLLLPPSQESHRRHSGPTGTVEGHEVVGVGSRQHSGQDGCGGMGISWGVSNQVRFIVLQAADHWPWGVIL